MKLRQKDAGTHELCLRVESLTLRALSRVARELAGRTTSIAAKRRVNQHMESSCFPIHSQTARTRTGDTAYDAHGARLYHRYPRTARPRNVATWATSSHGVVAVSAGVPSRLVEWGSSRTMQRSETSLP